MELCGKFYIPHRSRSDVFEIWPIADAHLGNLGTDIGAIERDVAAIKENPNAFWFGLGDLGDYIGKGDKRLDPTVLDIMVADLADVGWAIGRKVLGAFRPIARQCIGIGVGNHDRRYYLEKEQMHLHGHLLTQMRQVGWPGIADLGYSAFFDLIFVRDPTWRRGPMLMRTTLREGYERFRVRFVVHHGAGAAQSPGGKMNALERMRHKWDADVYVQAHNHDAMSKPFTILGADEACCQFRPRNGLLVRTGPYLRTYAKGVTGYAEIAMYDPTSLGATPIRINPQTRAIWAESGTRLAQAEEAEPARQKGGKRNG